MKTGPVLRSIPHKNKKRDDTGYTGGPGNGLLTGTCLVLGPETTTCDLQLPALHGRDASLLQPASYVWPEPAPLLQDIHEVLDVLQAEAATRMLALRLQQQGYANARAWHSCKDLPDRLLAYDIRRQREGYSLATDTQLNAVRVRR